MLVGSSLFDRRLVIYGGGLLVLGLSSRHVLGPRSNPANLPVEQALTINELFALVFQAAVETSTSPEPVKFLSRYDKSANNIRESNIWTSIGQTPWSHPYSSWYHRYVDFPFGALRAASRLGEYTLVDRGTWYAVGGEVRNKMMVFVSSDLARGCCRLLIVRLEGVL